MFVLLCTLNTNAQTIYYLEDFENGMPADYKTYDLDGLTPAAYPQFKGLGWIATGGIAASTSYYSPSGAANDWMVTKGISIPAASILTTEYSWFGLSKQQMPVTLMVMKFMYQKPARQWQILKPNC